MISYEEALVCLKSEKINWGAEKIPLAQAVGRVLYQDVRAREPNPRFDNSAMDGFALKLEKLSGFEIPVSGFRPAGEWGEVWAEGAIEITTGAALPEGFDTVVKKEDVEERAHRERTILLKRQPLRGENIRRRGEDCQAGDLLLKRGTLVRETHLLALASQGFKDLEVFKELGAMVLSTGDELADFEQRDLAPLQIRNSTGLFLEHRLNRLGLQVLKTSRQKDNSENFMASVNDGIQNGARILVSTGAVSVGRRDFVKEALDKMGATHHFHGVKIRPGKPILFSSLLYRGERVYFFGLPGNPLATTVGLKFFIEPFLDHLRGTESPGAFLPLTEEVRKPEGLRCFWVAVQNDGEVRLLPKQESFRVTPLLEANSWAVLPESPSHLKKGHLVEVKSL